MWIALDATSDHNRTAGAVALADRRRGMVARCSQLDVTQQYP